jgi:hypothetical protein
MLSWSYANDECLGLVAGGYSDWRLPSTMQLVSILDFSKWLPAINTTYFTGASLRPVFNDLPYWTKDTYRSGSNRRAVDLLGGVATYWPGLTSLYTRCTRTDPWPMSFTNNMDGTVRDNNTALVWQQLDDDTGRVWANALSYCNDLTLGGHSDWRLPSVKELISILDVHNIAPAIDNTVFPDTNRANYWTSTSISVDPSRAWHVNFDWSNNYYSDKATANYVRCVR